MLGSGVESGSADADIGWKTETLAQPAFSASGGVALASCLWGYRASRPMFLSSSGKMPGLRGAGVFPRTNCGAAGDSNRRIVRREVLQSVKDIFRVRLERLCNFLRRFFRPDAQTLCNSFLQLEHTRRRLLSRFDARLMVRVD